LITAFDAGNGFFRLEPGLAFFVQRQLSDDMDVKVGPRSAELNKNSDIRDVHE
jgi:hypothetical protein